MAENKWVFGFISKLCSYINIHFYEIKPGVWICIILTLMTGRNIVISNKNVVCESSPVISIR